MHVDVRRRRRRRRHSVRYLLAVSDGNRVPLPCSCCRAFFTPSDRRRRRSSVHPLSPPPHLTAYTARLCVQVHSSRFPKGKELAVARRTSRPQSRQIIIIVFSLDPVRVQLPSWGYVAVCSARCQLAAAYPAAAVAASVRQTINFFLIFFFFHPLVNTYPRLFPYLLSLFSSPEQHTSPLEY